jgi:general secretion pathway protein E
MNDVGAAFLVKLTDDAVLSARQSAKQSGRRVAAELASALCCTERDILAAIGPRSGHELWRLDELRHLTPAFELFPLLSAIEQNAVLFHSTDDSACMAVIGDPFNLELIARIEARARGSVQIVIAAPEDIKALLAQYEADARAVTSIEQLHTAADGDAQPVEVLSLAGAMLAGTPAVRIVNSTLYDAIKSGASDVHLEATARGLNVRYRLDGVLVEAASIEGVETSEQTLSRLKVLAELDIAERRVPQDGSFRVDIGGRRIDLRVSVMPSVHGEDAVIRILDKQRVIESTGRLTLDALGFDASTVVALRAMLEQPYGMLLVTGPTGSGKTTTLYAALAEIDTGRDKIITIEDPVEYQMPGILQIPVNDRKGLTFARGLRSILRHDPDKIMVGEIRDRETGEIAVQAALTGHLVLTTVHANNAFDVFSRFTHMNIDPFAFASALNGIWAQRLVRRVCSHCSEPIAMSDAELGLLRALLPGTLTLQLLRGRGCAECRGTGYRGRRAVAEILPMSDEVRELIAERRSPRLVRDAAQRRGFATIRAACAALVAAGETTMEELRRVAPAE